MNIIDTEQAVERLIAGEMIILTDDHDRENEGDIMVLADRIIHEQVEFMTRYARGLICVPLSAERAERLSLQPMVGKNSSMHGTAFTISVDAADGSTGISVSDRCETIRRLADPRSMPEALARPGHIFPLIAKDGGLSARDGHTEASIELARLCGAEDAAVICEILSGRDSGMARGEELQDFAKAHRLGILAISDLKDYLLKAEAESRLPTAFGGFTIRTYPDESSAEPTVVMVSDTAVEGEYLPVRIHSECFTGDVLGSLRCDCGEQLERSLEYIGSNGGMLIYLRQEGRGIGLTEKIKAYKLQEQGADTWQANLMLGHRPDERGYQAAVSILKKSGAERIGLLTNNPDKIEALQKAGFEVKRIPLEMEARNENAGYLETKKNKFNHLILGGTA